MVGSPRSPTPTVGFAFDFAKLGTIESDLTYCVVDDIELKLDLYYPNTMEGPWPTAVYVHGGAWQGGEKTTGVGYREVSELVGRDYFVAAVNYRLAPEYKFPAQIEDVMCAIRYLRTHAADYYLDPERIVAWGSSAGGHLVSLLGLADDSAGFNSPGGYADQSSRVAAVVDLFGPADLSRDFNRQVLEKVFGVSDETDPFLEMASPVTYASEDDPPFLIIHGEKDEVVLPGQSQVLYERLSTVGVEATLVVVKNAGHGFLPIGGKIQPTREEITRMVADFFDEQVK